MRFKGFKAGLIGATLCMSLVLLASPTYAEEIEAEVDEVEAEVDEVEAEVDEVEAEVDEVGEDALLDTEGTKRAYAVISDDRKILTFKYDGGYDPNSDKMWEVSNTGNNPGWIGGTGDNLYSKYGITSAVIEPSFAEARPNNCRYWFYMPTVSSISGLRYLNTSNVTDMKRMFYGDQKLTSIDLSSFDTSSVTDMSGMFSGCSGLTALDVSGFNTSNVTDMSGMFSLCRALDTLNVKNFNTSKVTDMSWMFSYCYKLTSLDLSGFDTSKVADMQSLFQECEKLTSVDISSFDTSNVTNMRLMFYLCSSLKSLDASKFNTSNVTTMESVFHGCENLTNIDVSRFNTSNVTDMSGMFQDCKSLVTIDVSGFDMSRVSNWKGMFFRCSNLTTIYCNNTWNKLENETAATSPFYGCDKLVGAIRYDNEKTFSEYANPDTGYFTRIEKKNDSKKDPIQVNNFVERMYTKALKRASEEAGKNDWVNQLLNGKSDGATLARGFICSNEFMDKNMSNEEYLDILYATFFDRPADEGGKAYWLDQLAGGRSRTGVLSGFVNSGEFGTLCENFGIARGTMEEDGSNIYNEGVYNFVKRNYTKTLGRDGEVAGIEDWCHRINKGELTMKDVAVSFLHSAEFLNKNTSNEEYVKVLYRTFMDREADAAGLADWVGQLDRGEKTRDEIVNGFSDSREFASIMANYQ